MGSLIWNKSYPASNTGYFYDVKETSTGAFIILGEAASYSNPVFTQLSAQGNVIWTTNIPIFDIHIGIGEIELTPDGNYISTVNTNNWPQINNYIVKVDTSGAILWSNLIDTISQIRITCLETTTDKGYILGGAKNPSNSPLAYLQKLDSLGNTYGNLITGTVYNDTDFDCQPTIGEDSLTSWLVKAAGVIGTTYTTVKSDGTYEILVDSGSYQVEVINNNPYWQSCQSNQVVNFNTFYDTLQVDFGVQATVQCPQLVVNVSTPFLRRCFDNDYVITYQNKGTQIAQNAYIEVEFDPFLVVNSSSVPWSSVNGNTYTFPIGTVNINESGSFGVSVTVDCNAVLGQSHCTEAHIYPDSICINTQQWDNVDIELDVECQSDSVQFEIHNRGSGNIISPLKYYVIEDNLIMRSGTFQLLAGMSHFISVPANGSTYRLETEQSPTHPESPLNRPSVHIEGCTTGSSFNTGFVTIYPQNDLMSYIDIDCQENIGSYDPNDKTGYPIGYDSQHYINQNQPLEYHIRFQNTGTDTAFNVVIKDVLDTTLLDISTLQVGTSSHPYSYALYDGNLIQFTFDNILLPDSNINEPMSHGFVRFTVNQKVNNPVGSTIHNSADIFFDFNAPITTNTTLHTIGQNFIINNTTPIKEGEVTVKVFPNPFFEYVQFEIEDNLSNFTFTITDVLGRVIEQRVVNNQFTFKRKNLPVGTYFYAIHHNDSIINSGKILCLE